jgi:NAD(P)-dependent dehydrogenase (short-subunit alcohol dehydrogenase family)
LVTGASAGIGRAFAAGLARRGHDLVLVARDGARLTALAAELAQAHRVDATACAADLLTAAGLAAVEARLTEAGHPIDILVNNAGFGGGMAPLHEQSTENWDRVHSVNIRGVFFGMKHGVISMLKSGGGSIVNISSASGFVGWKAHSIYGAAKAGVNQLTKTGALDYAPHKIRVNAVVPGTIWTGLVPASQETPEPPAGGYRLPGIPLDRWGTAREIAAAALFLASDEASYITGVLLPVDGGYCIGFSGMGAENSGKPDA